MATRLIFGLVATLGAYATACVSGETSTDTKTAPSDAQPETSGVETQQDSTQSSAEVTVLGNCVQPDAAVQANRLIYEDHYLCPPPSAPDTGLFYDDDAWTQMRLHLASCANGAQFGSVDFGSEYVAVLGVESSMTCGIDKRRVTVLLGDPGPYLEFEATNSSAGCVGACAMGDAFVVALAIPRSAGLEPTFCRRIHPGCP